MPVGLGQPECQVGGCYRSQYKERDDGLVVCVYCHPDHRAER